MSQASASIAREEIAQFSSHADDWWNPEGKFKPLHKLNPVRIAYVRDHICRHKKLNLEGKKPLKGLKILDIGCGGGLMTEPLARLGGDVTGLDASEVTIEIARQHAQSVGLKINYQIASAEMLVERPQRYDVVTALEVVEHVADIKSFLGAISELLKPDGLLIMSTLNRTTKSFFLGIVAAEYVLNWLPRGTHQWNKFMRPSRLVHNLAELGINTHDITGLVFNPWCNEFQLSKEDFDVNYLLSATKR